VIYDLKTKAKIKRIYIGYSGYSGLNAKAKIKAIHRDEGDKGDIIYWRLWLFLNPERVICE